MVNSFNNVTLSDVMDFKKTWNMVKPVFGNEIKAKNNTTFSRKS